MIELYKHTKDGIRYWSIDWDYGFAEIEINHGVYEGALQTNYENVEVNQSGRSIEDQIDLRVKSRVASKKDIGYRETIGEARSAAGTNVLGHCRPMLATRYDKIKNINWDRMYVQSKYDGHRCMVRRTLQGYVAYSRNGREIKTIDHIFKDLNIPVGMTLDGELYSHGTPLQTITSWIKKKQHSTQKLEYVVYDYVSDEPYSERYNALMKLGVLGSVRIAPTDRRVMDFQIILLLESAISSGYEGLILRDKDSPYETGKRSKGLIKIKKFDDDEFKVVNIIPSKDQWAILVCHNHDGKEFRVLAPGIISEKERILIEKDNYIGKSVTVQFANMTSDGIPFHPVAIGFREDI